MTNLPRSVSERVGIGTGSRGTRGPQSHPPRHYPSGDLPTQASAESARLLGRLPHWLHSRRGVATHAVTCHTGVQVVCRGRRDQPHHPPHSGRHGTARALCGRSDSDTSTASAASAPHGHQQKRAPHRCGFTSTKSPLAATGSCRRRHVPRPLAFQADAQPRHLRVGDRILWVAFAIGLLLGGIEPDAGLFLIAILVTSGANTATQIIVAVVFALGVLAIVELTLISYLVAPAKTQAVVQLLHDWALTHRRKILIAMCIVAGISLLIHGLGGI